MPEEKQFTIETLNAEKHRRDSFRCEAHELTEFLQKRARKEMDARVSACFVMVPADDPGRIAGFYTLSAAAVVASQLPEDATKRLPRYPELPATLLGRLARDFDFRGAGAGDLLISSAMSRALANSSVVGSVALVTDPLDEKAGAFYAKYGFQLLLERPHPPVPANEIDRRVSPTLAEAQASTTCR